MDWIAYLLKRYLPRLFGVLEHLARWLVVIRFGRRVKFALDRGTIRGTLNDRQAVMRPLNVDDLNVLEIFFANLPNEHLNYFRPHDFDSVSLKQVLLNRAILTYGLFINNELSGYGLLKISPTGSAFLGLLVAPGSTGLGIGRFLVGYLYWQSRLAQLKTRSTVSKNNPASIKAHEAVAPFRVIAELPDDYIMIEFPNGDPQKPRLGQVS